MMFVGGGSVQRLVNVIGHWDANNASTTTTFIDDLVGTADLTGANMQTSTINGVACLARNAVASGALTSTASPLSTLTVFGVTTVTEDTGFNGAIYVDTRNNASVRPAAYGDGTSTHMFATADVAVSAETLIGVVHYFEFNGAASKYFRNGVQVGGAVNLGAVVAASATLKFGNIYSNSNNTAGANTWRFGEAKVSTGTQTNAAILGEASVLKAKWGIP